MAVLLIDPFLMAIAIIDFKIANAIKYVKHGVDGWMPEVPG
jgi:hypothetical protein